MSGSHRRVVLLICLIALSLVRSPIADAQDVWTITRGDFTESRGAIRSISAAGITVDGVAGVSGLLAWDDILELSRVSQRPGLPDGVWAALLGDGARLIGTPVGMRGESLIWTTAVGEFLLPLSGIRAIARGGEVEAALLDAPAQDTVSLANGDRIAGIIESITPEGVVVAGSPEVGWQAILAVKFAGVRTGDQSAEESFLVRLASGAVLTGDALEQQGGRLLISRKGGATANVAVVAVLAIEHRNGPVSWLTDVEPGEVEVRPYFGESAPAVWFGDGLTSDAVKDGERGARTAIVASSYSRLEYAIEPAARAFRTRFMIDGQLPYANCIVRFKLDDNVVYELTDLTAATPPQTVTFPLNAARKLSIEVDYGKTFDVQDRVLFIEPAFLKRLPAPSTQPGV